MAELAVLSRVSASTVVELMVGRDVGVAQKGGVEDAVSGADLQAGEEAGVGVAAGQVHGVVVALVEDDAAPLLDVEVGVLAVDDGVGADAGAHAVKVEVVEAQAVRTHIQADAVMRLGGGGGGET
ncbi:hypothetical protein FRC98_11360 [Lujinxingia vulgaris]|uniref:Uncharacterized protein n=1 Tax=Lujinxingia vulgaris TaxID=2600176 RepID=A0A5C6X691_9DELT|nr:hypothetical protein FRC98_11360 [Lujinxingia vulgaris]